MPVVLLLPLVGAYLAVWQAAEHAERQYELGRHAGEVFGKWVLALHRATQTARRTEWPQHLPAPGQRVTQARLTALGAVPPGLPTSPGHDGTMQFGVLDDDGVSVAGRWDTAMGFAVIEFSSEDRVQPAAIGAIDAGLADVAVRIGGSETRGSPIEEHRARIEARMGRAIGDNAIYVTSDHGIRYHASALYRRPQPGRPELSRMGADLALGGHDVASVAAIRTRDIALSGNAEVQGVPAVAGAPDPISTVEADLVVGTALSPATATVSGALTAEQVAIECTGATGDCLTAAATEAGALTVAGALQAREVAVTDRLEAGSFVSIGRGKFGIAAVEGTATAGTRVRVDQDATAILIEADALTLSGAATAATLRAGDLDADTIRAANVDADRAFGPAAAITGQLTVSGSCSGCDWDGSP